MWAIKYMVDEDKIRTQIEQNKKKPKKKSKFQQRMEDIAKQQQKRSVENWFNYLFILLK